MVKHIVPADRLEAGKNSYSNDGAQLEMVQQTAALQAASQPDPKANSKRKSMKKETGSDSDTSDNQKFYTPKNSFKQKGITNTAGVDDWGEPFYGSVDAMNAGLKPGEAVVVFTNDSKNAEVAVITDKDYAATPYPALVRTPSETKRDVEAYRRAVAEQVLEALVNEDEAKKRDEDEAARLAEELEAVKRLDDTLATCAVIEVCEGHTNDAAVFEEVALETELRMNAEAALAAHAEAVAKREAAERALVEAAVAHEEAAREADAAVAVAVVTSAIVEDEERQDDVNRLTEKEKDIIEKIVSDEIPK